MMDRCLEGSIHFLTFGFRPDVQSADFFYVPLALALQYPYVKYKVFVLVWYILLTYLYNYVRSTCKLHNLPLLLHVSDQLHQLEPVTPSAGCRSNDAQKERFLFQNVLSSVCRHITWQICLSSVPDSGRPVDLQLLSHIPRIGPWEPKGQVLPKLRLCTRYESKTPRSR